MTLLQIKQYNDDNIRQQNASGSVTRNVVATAIDNIANYLSTPPAASLSIDKPAHEAGDTGPATLSWTATPGDNPITSITVAGTPITPTGSGQSGTQSAAFSASADSAFAMSVGDGSKTASASVTSYLRKKIRIGATTVATPADADILALSVQQFATTFNYSGSIVCANQYLAIYIPHSFGTPQFKINGLYNNAFTKIRDNQAFVNAFSVSEQGDLYMSNTLLTGTLNLEVL